MAVGASYYAILFDLILPSLPNEGCETAAG
jgi:hypothetical protein